MPTRKPDTPPHRVAVIDIGSNSIKLLVAERGQSPGLLELAQRTKETRIGTGITGNPPRLDEAAIDRAIVSIRSLLAEAANHAPDLVRLVATSAVRDAANRESFAARLKSTTGHELVILTGDEEARLIGRGIGCDPALRGVAAFYLFDLGGGSLEMLEFRDGRVAQLVSTQLGCVRVTGHCVSNPAMPLPETTRSFIRGRTREVIIASGFRFHLPRPAPAVVTGGTATTFRAMRAAAREVSLRESSSVIAAEEIFELGERLSSLTIDDRRAIPGMPAARADVLPAALITLGEVASMAAVQEFRHSLYNLRFGLAAELLGG